MGRREAGEELEVNRESAPTSGGLSGGYGGVSSKGQEPNPAKKKKHLCVVGLRADWTPK